MKALLVLDQHGIFRRLGRRHIANHREHTALKKIIENWHSIKRHIEYIPRVELLAVREFCTFNIIDSLVLRGPWSYVKSLVCAIWTPGKATLCESL